MNTPAGLTRFSRTIVSKRNGSCEFCNAPTHADQDYACVNGGSGKWIAVCRTCSLSLTEQVKGIVRRLSESTTDPAVITTISAMIPQGDALIAALNGTCSPNESYDAIVRLAAAVDYVKTASVQADPLLGKLQFVAADPSRTPRDREFAGSLATCLATRGSLSDKQRFYADKLVVAPAAPSQGTAESVKADVPQGYYATPSRTGNNDLDFWQIDRPTTGKWAGYTFVKRIIGGHDPIRIRGAEAKTVLATIADHGVEAAGLAYANAIGTCYRCNRDLTDEESRRTGLGPVCRNKA